MSGFDVWRLIGTAPNGRLVRVCGDSGYGTHRWFDCTAIFDADRGQWLDVTGEPLQDSGWKPQYWKEAGRYPKEDPRNG